MELEKAKQNYLNAYAAYQNFINRNSKESTLDETISTDIDVDNIDKGFPVKVININQDNISEYKKLINNLKITQKLYKETI